MTTVERFEKNIDQVNSDFQAIKSKIVECGVEVADGTKTAELAEKVSEVFEAGKKSEYDAFWDTFQQNGNRRDYSRALSGEGWTPETFKPKYSITNFLRGDHIFSYTTRLKIDIADYFERNGLVLDFSKATNMTNACDYCYATRIGVVDVRSAKTLTSNLFANSRFITIDKLLVSEENDINKWFNYCEYLENLTIEGTIGKNGLNLQWSTKLSKASILSVLNALSTITSGLTVTLSLVAVNKAFETSEGANDGSDSQEFLVWTEEGPEFGYRSNWTIALA